MKSKESQVVIFKLLILMSRWHYFYKISSGLNLNEQTPIRL